MNAKKEQSHMNSNLVPEDLAYQPRSLSRQQPRQSYSGTVMSDALQRQQQNSTARTNQSGQATRSATATASSPHSTAVNLTQSSTQRMQQPRQAVSIATAEQHSTRPASGGQHSSTYSQGGIAQERMHSRRPTDDRIDHILDYAIDAEQRHTQRQSASGTYRRTPATRQMPTVSQAQWYAYPVAGSNTSLLLSIVVCLFLGFVLLATPLGEPLGLYTKNNSILSFFRGESTVTEKAVPPQLTPDGEHSILGTPSISAQEIDHVLRQYDSPAVGQGKAFYELGKKYNIDPAYALAFFIHESSAGTNSGWAGLKSDGSSTHNVGNIICAGYKTCYNRFRDYASWEEGIEDWYRLLSVEYIEGRGTSTVEQIIPIYAPSFENDVPAYVNAVTALVNEWRERGVQ